MLYSLYKQYLAWPWKGVLLKRNLSKDNSMESIFAHNEIHQERFHLPNKTIPFLVKWEDDVLNVFFFFLIRRQVTIPNIGQAFVNFYQTSFFSLWLLEGYFVKAYNG